MLKDEVPLKERDDATSKRKDVASKCLREVTSLAEV